MTSRISARNSIGRHLRVSHACVLFASIISLDAVQSFPNAENFRLDTSTSEAEVYVQKQLLRRLLKDFVGNEIIDLLTNVEQLVE
jgi:hypothetical protein